MQCKDGLLYPSQVTSALESKDGIQDRTNHWNCSLCETGLYDYTIMRAKPHNENAPTVCFANPVLTYPWMTLSNVNALWI